MAQKRIYMDCAAATPVAPAVLSAMQPYFKMHFGNASSLHAEGQAASQVLEQSRGTVAKLLGCNPGELVFTSGGTESINTALNGVLGNKKAKKNHVISTTIEHAATLAALNALKRRGHRITLVPCAPNGIVNVRDVLNAIRPETSLISIILAQNEIGTIQPVEEIGRKLIAINRERAKKNLSPVLLHVDACQAPAFLKITIPKLHADLLSLDASKFYGPKGVGLLFVRKGVAIEPLLHGGGQQHGLRSGTEPTALIAGFAAALEYVGIMRLKETPRIRKLREYLLDRVIKEIPNTIVTGDRSRRLANNASFAFAGIEGESLVLRLDRAGIAASTGSACSTVDLKPSHVVAALRLPARYQDGSLRLTLGYAITKKQVDTVIMILKRTVSNLRKK